MSRTRNNAKVNASVPEEVPVPRVMLTSRLYALLRDGKTKAVMTWKEFETRPAMIRVETPCDDQVINCKVLSMHRCFHGFKPEGFPESEASRGRSTVFDVTIIEPIASDGNGHE